MTVYEVPPNKVHVLAYKVIAKAYFFNEAGGAESGRFEWLQQLVITWIN